MVLQALQKIRLPVFFGKPIFYAMLVKDRKKFVVFKLISSESFLYTKNVVTLC